MGCWHNHAALRGWLCLDPFKFLINKDISFRTKLDTETYYGKLCDFVENLGFILTYESRGNFFKEIYLWDSIIWISLKEKMTKKTEAAPAKK